MLVSLEGYEEDELLGKFKKLKKIAKSAIKTGLKVAAASMGIPPKLLDSALSLAKGTVKSSPKVQDSIEASALAKIGVDSVDNLSPTQKVQYEKEYRTQENYAIKATTQKILAQDNQSASSSTSNIMPIVNQAKPSGISAGDKLFKQGLLKGLLGDDDQDIKLLATKIYAQNPYPTEVPFESEGFVDRVIRAYIYCAQALSQAAGKNMYYNGTTAAEQAQFYGNIYIRACYMYIKGVTTDADVQNQGYDYSVRDQIWVILSTLMSFAKADSSGTFKKFWQPASTGTASTKISLSPTSSFLSNPAVLIGGAGLLYFALGKKKKKR